MQHNLTVRDVRRDDRPPFPFAGVWTEFKGLGGFGMCNGPCFIYSIPWAELLGRTRLRFGLSAHGEIILQPKGDGKGGIGDFYSIYALGLSIWHTAPTSSRAIIHPLDQTHIFGCRPPCRSA
jgi:hypothetical protein